MNQAQQKSDFSKGSMGANILRLAVPMSLALLINVLYSVVDRIYIGNMPQNGTMALTGIGLAFPITTIISAFYSLCATGGAPLCSIARGEGDSEKAEKIMGNAFFLLCIFSVLLTAAAYLCKQPVLWLTGATENTFGYANDYLNIYLLGTPFVMFSLGLNPFINCQGFAKTGMMTVLLGAVVNIVLDPVFIFVFGLGVQGAAIATVLAQGCSAVWVLLFLTGKKALLRLKLRCMRPSLPVISKTLALGVTGFTMAVTSSAVSMVYNGLLRTMGGDIYVTAMTVINSVREMTFMPISGLNNAAQPVIGYNYGAKQYGRVRSGIKLITVFFVAYSVLIWVMLLAFPQLFIRMFNSDPNLLAVGKTALRIYFCAIVCMAFQMTGQCVFVALGKSRQAIFFSLLRKAILVIPLAYLLPNLWNLGIYGVFLSEPVSDVVGGLSCFLAMVFTVYRHLPKEPAQMH